MRVVNEDDVQDFCDKVASQGCEFEREDRHVNVYAHDGTAYRVPNADVKRFIEADDITPWQVANWD
jgi:hypothetical protein